MLVVSLSRVLVVLGVVLCGESGASKEVFTNSFYVRFRRSLSAQEANDVAETHGYRNLGPVSAF